MERIFLKKDPAAEKGHRAPRAGEIVKNPLLAKTLRLLGEKGKQGFYEGPLAEAIVGIIKNMGGYLSLEDLKNHGTLGSEITEPVAIRVPERFASDQPAGALNPEIDLWSTRPAGRVSSRRWRLGYCTSWPRTGRYPNSHRRITTQLRT